MIKKLIKKLIPWYNEYLECERSTRTYFGYCEYVKYKLGLQKVYWPKDKTCLVANARRIYVGKNSLVGRPCSYFQGSGKVYISDYVQFGPNVGVQSANHDLYDQRKSVAKPIRIGDYCWIGMGSIILAGVELGPRTIVGANSIVTKSFPEGYCVIAGNPAKVVKLLDKDKFVPWHEDREFYGFIPKERFEKERRKYIDI